MFLGLIITKHWPEQWTFSIIAFTLWIGLPEKGRVLSLEIFRRPCKDISFLGLLMKSKASIIGGGSIEVFTVFICFKSDFTPCLQCRRKYRYKSSSLPNKHKRHLPEHNSILLAIPTHTCHKTTLEANPCIRQQLSMWVGIWQTVSLR